MTDSAELDDLLGDHAEPVAGTVLRLRDVLRAGRPDLVERVRPGWHSVNYHDPAAGFVCAVFPFADRVQLVFEHGILLPDPHHRLTGTGRQVRALEFAAESDVDAEVVLEFLDLAVEIGRGARKRRVRG